MQLSHWLSYSSAIRALRPSRPPMLPTTTSHDSMITFSLISSSPPPSLPPPFPSKWIEHDQDAVGGGGRNGAHWEAGRNVEFSVWLRCLIGGDLLLDTHLARASLTPRPRRHLRATPDSSSERHGPPPIELEWPTGQVEGEEGGGWPQMAVMSRKGPFREARRDWWKLSLLSLRDFKCIVIRFSIEHYGQYL